MLKSGGNRIDHLRPRNTSKGAENVSKILLFYVFFMFCSCFVVIVVLCIFIFVCTSVGLLPPGESPTAVSK
jgi:hypothetical protein